MTTEQKQKIILNHLKKEYKEMALFFKNTHYSSFLNNLYPLLHCQYKEVLYLIEFLCSLEKPDNIELEAIDLIFNTIQKNSYPLLKLVSFFYTSDCVQDFREAIFYITENYE